MFCSEAGLGGGLVTGKESNIPERMFCATGL